MKRKPGPIIAIDTPVDRDAQVKRLARETVGQVKPAQVIEPKKQRKKPKHKRPPGEDE